MDGNSKQPQKFHATLEKSIFKILTCIRIFQTKFLVLTCINLISYTKLEWLYFSCYTSMLRLGFQELHKHCCTSIDFTECSYDQNVKVAFGVRKVDIFYFPFATMFLKTKTKQNKTPRTGQIYGFEYRNKV